MIIHCNLSQMKNKILPTCLQGNYRDTLGEFRNTSYGVLGAERVNTVGDVELLNSSRETKYFYDFMQYPK